MKTTTLTIDVTYKGSTSLGIEFETGDNIEDFILTFVNDEAGFRGENDEWEEVTDMEDITYEVTDWGDAEDYENLHNIDLLNEIAEADPSYDWDVISAAIDCDIQPVDIDEAYSGEYSSDEDFAEETAESCGMIDKSLSWPYTCIDWECAARELMYDYSEANGHYFRNL